MYEYLYMYTYIYTYTYIYVCNKHACTCSLTQHDKGDRKQEHVRKNSALAKKKRACARETRGRDEMQNEMEIAREQANDGKGEAVRTSARTQFLCVWMCTKMTKQRRRARRKKRNRRWGVICNISGGGGFGVGRAVQDGSMVVC